MNDPSVSTYAAFEAVDIRVGTIVDAQSFPQARKPSYQLTVDFGTEIGIRRSSAQLTVHYATGQLIGTQVIAVINLPPKRIAGFRSEILVLGIPDSHGHVVLMRPERPVPNGGRLL